MPESTNKNSLNDPTKKYFAIQRYVGIVVAFALVILTVLIYKLSNSANNGDFYDFTIADKNSPILQLNFSSNEESFDLSEFKGKPLILAFWAGWCEPCLAEMPIMLKTYGLNEGFTIITINLDSEEKYIQSGREFIDNFKPSLNQIHFFRYDFIEGDPLQHFADNMGVSGIPWHIVTDKNHKIRFQGGGSIDWSSPQLQSDLNDLL